MLAVAVVGTVAGIAADSSSRAQLVVAGGLLFAIMATWQLVQPGSLTLSHAHFEVRQFWRVRRYEFARCDPFVLRRISGPLRRPEVVFLYRSIGEPPATTATGYSDMLPDTYGYTPEALAAQLNELRERALRSV